MTGLDRVKQLADARKMRAAGDHPGQDAVWKEVAAAQKAAPKKPDYTPTSGATAMSGSAT